MFLLRILSAMNNLKKKNNNKKKKQSVKSDFSEE